MPPPNPPSVPIGTDPLPPDGVSAATAEPLARWFTEEVQCNEASLKAYLRSAFPTVRDVDDVVQESYLRVCRAQRSSPLRSAKAFLFTVARRLALDWMRHERRSPLLAVGNPATLGVLDDGPGVAEIVSAHEKVELLADGLLTLPPRCRAVLMLYRLKGLSRSEVAHELGIAEKTVDEQAARGVRRLEDYFRSRGLDRIF